MVQLSHNLLNNLSQIINVDISCWSAVKWSNNIIAIFKVKVIVNKTLKYGTSKYARYTLDLYGKP